MRIAIILIVLLVILPVAVGQLAYDYVPLPTEGVAEVEPAQIQYWQYACTESDTRCDGARFQKCRSNEWLTYDSCTKDERCDPDKGCMTTTVTRIAPTPILEPRPLLPTPIKPITPIRMYKTKLVCPVIPRSGPRMPLAPWGVNDCDLVGKSAEIEAYLTALEAIADGCKDRRAAAWANVLTTRTDLDNQVDLLEVPEGGGEMIAACPIYTGDMEPIEPVGGSEPENMYYTRWLQRIAENTAKYCRLIDQLAKPLRQACDEINFYQDCQAPNPTQYHALINAKMNAENINYEYTAFFYTSALQTYGWGNFREYFNESYIDCPGKVMRMAPLPSLEVRGIEPQMVPPQERTLPEGMTYDEFGRVKKKTTEEKKTGKEIPSESIEDVAYDKFGRVIKLVIKEQCAVDKFTTKTIEFVYDKFGQVTKQVEVIKDGCEDKITTTITVFTYDQFGNVIEKHEESVPGASQLKKEVPVLQRIASFFRKLFGRPRSGDRSFYVDESGIIRPSNATPATPADSPIGG